MAYKTKARQTEWHRENNRKKSLENRTCETCGNRPADRHHKGNESTRTIAICGPCHAAISRVISR